MDIRVGDNVRFLNTTGGGVVVKIIDKLLVEVLDASGFNIPVLKNELVRIPGESNAKVVETKRREDVVAEQHFEPEEEVEIAGNDMPNLLMALVPQSSELQAFDLFLINDCNFHFLYNYSTKSTDKYKSVESGTVEANTKVFLQTFLRENVNDTIKLCFQGVFFKQKEYNMQKPVQENIEISAVKLFKQGVFKENDFFDEDALILEICKDDLIAHISKLDNDTFKKVIFEKEIKGRKRRELSRKDNKEIKSKIVEVDLHIHELVDTEAGLEPADKLEIQLSHFEEKLNEAITANESKIVFIHGVGNGVLKMKIRNLLDRNYPKLKYQDASFEKYKFGATLVSL